MTGSVSISEFVKQPERSQVYGWTACRRVWKLPFCSLVRSTYNAEIYTLPLILHCRANMSYANLDRKILRKMFLLWKNLRFTMPSYLPTLQKPSRCCHSEAFAEEAFHEARSILSLVEPPLYLNVGDHLISYLTQIQYPSAQPTVSHRYSTATCKTPHEPRRTISYRIHG